MRKKAFTLIEMIIAIVILGILSAGTFVSIKNLYLKVLKSKAMSDLSSDSQNLADQISLLLYDRLPYSVIGYDGNSSFASIYALDKTYPVLEWIGTSVEALKKREYSGLVDMEESNETSFSLKSPDTNIENVVTTVETKLHTTNLLTNQKLALAFSGTFDDGVVLGNDDFLNFFGWHNNTANRLYVISSLSTIDNLKLVIKPDTIYEKYYLVDSGYSIARGIDVDLTASCIQALNQSVDSNTLFLFYDFRPWNSETYCADKGSLGNKLGGVTILSNEVIGFEIGLLNENIYFNLTLQRGVPKKSSESNVTISKQKVVY